jgi:hypothetical protein
MILLAVAVILVSPLADIDDAVHHHQHHQNVGLSVSGEVAVMNTLDSEHETSTEVAMTAPTVDSTSSALRC